MSATFIHQPASLYGCGSIDVPAGGSSRLFPKLLSPRFSYNHKLHPVLASTSPVDHTSSKEPILSSYQVPESTLILIRHGESMWNEKNLFTGCCDVPLTRKGVEEAIEAGKRISYIPVDMIFTSGLIRAQMTAMLAMTQHHEKKVLIPFLEIVSFLIKEGSLC